MTYIDDSHVDTDDHNNGFLEEKDPRHAELSKEDSLDIKFLFGIHRCAVVFAGDF